MNWETQPMYEREAIKGMMRDTSVIENIGYRDGLSGKEFVITDKNMISLLKENKTEKSKIDKIMEIYNKGYERGQGSTNEVDSEKFV